MTVPTEQPTEVYVAAHDSIGDTALKDVRVKSGDIVSNFLMYFPEPKSYREFRNMAQVLAESTLLWSVAEGYVTLTEKGAVTDADRANRLVSVAPTNQAVANTVTGGGYA